VRGVILAGGGATRFEGRPKGLEMVGGRRILDRVADVLFEALGTPPLIVANAPEATSWRPDLEVAADDRTGFGALGGLYTAVVKGPAPVVVVAWDMPFLVPLLIREVAAGLADADACLPSSGGPRGVEPLCAAYGPGCRAAIERCLAGGDLRAIGFHRFIRVSILPIESVSGLVDPALAFFNVNTANDLAEAEASWQARASSRS
jgi:molybdopterin-guanine dinucleotide biosynthesis protein A